MKYSPVCRTIQINGKQHYLWRAVDQDGEVVDVFLQAKRDGATAKRFFRRLMRSYGGEPRKIVTDKLCSYGVAHRELMPEVIHDASQYANNRAEQSHGVTRVRERGMRKFKSIKQAQRFVTAQAAVHNLFNIGRLRGIAIHLALVMIQFEDALSILFISFQYGIKIAFLSTVI
jgi:putative transposase